MTEACDRVMGRVTGRNVRRALLLYLVLTLITALSTGCTKPASASNQNRPQKPKVSSFEATQERMSPKLRFMGPGLESGGLTAEDLRRDLPFGEKITRSLDELRRGSPKVRLPSSTLAGDPFLASLGEEKCRVYYDNGVQLEERWGELGRRAWPGTYCSGFAKAASIETTVGAHVAHAAERVRFDCIDCHGSAVCWCGDCTHTTEMPRQTDLKTSFISWKADGTLFLLASCYHDAEQLRRIAGSIR